MDEQSATFVVTSFREPIIPRQCSGCGSVEEGLRNDILVFKKRNVAILHQELDSREKLTLFGPVEETTYKYEPRGDIVAAFSLCPACAPAVRHKRILEYSAGAFACLSLLLAGSGILIAIGTYGPGVAVYLWVPAVVLFVATKLCMSFFPVVPVEWTAESNRAKLYYDQIDWQFSNPAFAREFERLNQAQVWPLERVAKYGHTEALRTYAWDRLDQHALMRILENSEARPYCGMSESAVSRLADSALLAKIATSSSRPSVRETAVLNPNLEDPVLLKRVVQDDPSREVRHAARARIAALGKASENRVP